MNSLLRRTLERVIRNGNLIITAADGQDYRFGDGSGPPAHIVIHTSHAEWAITRDPMLAFPESYMSGEVDFIEGDSLRLLSVVYQNVGLGLHGNVLTRMIEGTRNLFKRLQQLNTASRAKQNVHRHYDLSGELYKLFLDEDMQYSCAYFERPDMTLEEAQLAKKRHLAAKLLIKPDQRVLDIGSGWGGLGLHLARHCDANVLGVTLSTEQLAVANERAKAAGMEQRARFELTDYRDLKEPFDRIVSVGMFEHVGVNHFATFFEQSARLLKKDGIMVLHAIGRNGPPIATGAFIRKYIFPGGYIPSLSEVLPAIEKAGLMVNDVEILRFHYAETLKAWQERFQAHRDRAKEIYDERFCRMWEFYLAASEAAFRWQELMVFQIQLTHRNDVVPLTRGYIDQFAAGRQAIPSRTPASVNGP